MNIRGGLNRIYIALWVLWGLVCIWHPHYYHRDLYNSWLRLEEMYIEGCRESSGKECGAEYDQRSEKVKTDDDEQRSRQLRNLCLEAKFNSCREKNKDTLFSKDQNAYERMEPKHPYLWLAAFIVIPPVVLYGVLFGLMKLLTWIVGGFTNTHK